MNEELFDGIEAEQDYYDVEDIGDDYYGEDIEEEDDYYSEELEAAEASFWPDELEAFEMAEGANYLPEDYMSEILAEYEPDDMFDDSAELAETLREVLHEDYQDATPEEMEEALFNILETMTPAEGFNFKKALRQVSKSVGKVLRDPTVGQIAKSVLPVAGGALGTFVGGPIGTALGAKLGQAAGQAFSGGRKPPTTSAAAKAAQTSPKGGSAAAAQLLQLTQNPNVLKSIMSLALGSHGKKSMRVAKGGPSVSVGGVMNLLSTLLSKAAADADELLRESDDASAYLQDSEGNFRADPADSEDRAQALYDALSGIEDEQLAAEAAERYGRRRYYRYRRPLHYRYRRPHHYGY